jgi:hypothetical protein
MRLDRPGAAAQCARRRIRLAGRGIEIDGSSGQRARIGLQVVIAGAPAAGPRRLPSASSLVLVNARLTLIGSSRAVYEPLHYADSPGADRWASIRMPGARRASRSELTRF